MKNKKYIEHIDATDIKLTLEEILEEKTYLRIAEQALEDKNQFIREQASKIFFHESDKGDMSFKEVDEYFSNENKDIRLEARKAFTKRIVVNNLTVPSELLEKWSESQYEDVRLFVIETCKDQYLQLKKPKIKVLEKHQSLPVYTGFGCWPKRK